MRKNITQKLRDFWDAGIRGPDFVWAATGPALEAFSKHPAVKKANDPDQLMTVSEFLREVRRMVVDFVVGRVLTAVGGQEAVSGLDDVTTYYLLHRNDFGMDDAPVGACILYALSCNLSDSALVSQHDLLAQSGGGQPDGEDDDEDAAEGEEPGEAGGSGARLRLKAWSRRNGSNLGLEGPGGRPAPLIDQVHRLMRLWRAGDQSKVDDYLDTRGLPRNALFNQILQSLIELADERSGGTCRTGSAEQPCGSPRRCARPASANYVWRYAMITSLRLVNFKNFVDETLRVGPFTVIVGTNASGKSNIRDAFRFLHGIGRGYYLPDNLGGKYWSGGQLEWAGIRGAMNEIIRLGQQAFSFVVEARLEDSSFYYSLEAEYGHPEDGGFLVKSEELKVDQRPLFACHREGQMLFVDIGDVENPRYPRRPNAPFLSDATQIFWPPNQNAPIEDPAFHLKSFFASMRFLDLVPDLMREPAFPGSKLGDSGRNLATALETICDDPHHKSTLMAWLQELTPMDVVDFEFPRDPSGRVHLRIVERGGRSISAYSASDGTLRFLGMLAALLGHSPAGVLLLRGN